ncbi:WxcM-like domain-containing protein [Allomuricauda sp.]|uniref:WxcM-like domain-containing protein n=1 Tax=Flagellimonas alginolytica TaxID=3177515 RepID=UPI0025EB3CCD|nr:WxcM-like domain-containing protein [Allomuricauda sp.]
MRNNLVIAGDTFQDERGEMRFFNSLNMNEIVRFYEISPANQDIIRGWQGHQHEKKWFYCLSGGFVINIIEINDFNRPSEDLTPIRVELESSNPRILAVPGGFVTAIRATSNNARLQVFSNAALNDSKNDDFRFPIDQWSAEW